MSAQLDATQRAALDPEEARGKPLVVDVDGTLIRSDLLIESALQFVAGHPLEVWKLPAWLSAGKSVLKSKLAERVALNVETLPLREATVAWIREAQAQERPVYLASASNERYVEALARQIGGIAGVFATDLATNLAGDRKAARLIEAFGAGGFDYIGDDPVDMPVWRAAGSALAITRTRRFEAEIRRSFATATILERPRPQVRAYLRALRPHQWVKNILIFLPMLSGHLFDATSVLTVFGALACFCAAASSAYLINDLLDLPADREHHRKRNRPFASGAIPLVHGPVMAAALLLFSVAGALALSLPFCLVLLFYIGTTLAYSLVLKRELLIDVITLGGLYTVRVLAGVVVLGTRKSPWLLMFCLFLFLSLAIVKRCSELVVKLGEGKLAVTGRGYRVSDLGVMNALAAAAGFGAVLVFALYIASPDVVALYSHPNYLWLVCPLLLYWVSRLLMLASRGEMHDDPVVFAMTDRTSLLTGLSVAAIIGAGI